MTKEHAYAYEAGYRDGSTNYELEHCPACKNVADLQDALDEIAKLREYAHGLELENIRLDSDNCDLRGEMEPIWAENAKLRELVRDMLPFAEVGMDDACVTRRCCLFEQCEDTTVVKCAIEQHMLDRMRELGIEV